MNDWLGSTPLGSIPGAVAAGVLAGTLLPLLGMWVVLQRVVFLGITLAQVAAAGVALGLVLDLPAMTLGAALTGLSVLGLAATGRGRVANAGDSTLGATFCAASALALLFVSRSAGDLDQVHHVLHGNLIYADMDDVRIVGGALLIGVLAVLLGFRQILFCTFDPDTATAQGMPARRWLLFLFFVLAFVLSVSMRTTGSLLTFAMLVLPPLAALRLARGLRMSFVLASALGLVGTVGGLLLAVGADLHVESSITIALFALLPVCAAFGRGPVAGTAALVVTLALAAGLVVASRPASPSDEHPHVLHEAEDDGEHEPYHIDVTLQGRSDGDGSLVVTWTADVHCVAGPDVLPAQLWLILTGDGGLAHEHELLHDMRRLPRGDSRHHGTFRVPDAGSVHRIGGQLWTGRSEDFDAGPLESGRGSVLGADVTR